MFKFLQKIVLLAFIVVASSAQAWPTRPVTLVLPYSPGGGTDLLARSLQDRLSQTLGQSVIIDYKPGGGGMIAINHVMVSNDDHKLLFTTTDLVITSGIVHSSFFKFDNLLVVSTLTQSPLILAATPNSKYTDFKSVLSRLPTDSVSFGSPGVGSTSHLVLEKMLEPIVEHPIIVHYRGGNPMAIDTVGGHNNLSISSYGGTHQPFIDSGQLQAVVSFSEKRLPKLPNVPTAKEFGINIVASVSNMVFSINTLSTDQVALLNRAFTAAVTEPATQAKLTDRGNEVLAYSVRDSQKFFDNEVSIWSSHAIKVHQQTTR